MYHKSVTFHIPGNKTSLPLTNTCIASMCLGLREENPNSFVASDKTSENFMLKTCLDVAHQKSLLSCTNNHSVMHGHQSNCVNTSIYGHHHLLTIPENLGYWNQKLLFNIPDLMFSIQEKL